MSAVNRFNLGLFNSGTYSPHIESITVISQAPQAVITTADDHSFVVGNEVQFFIPKVYGMQQINKEKGFVIDVSSLTQFTVDIDTSAYDAFAVPAPAPFIVYDPAQVAGIGDGNTGNFCPGGVPPTPNTIPGSFQNQPP